MHSRRAIKGLYPGVSERAVRVFLLYILDRIYNHHWNSPLSLLMRVFAEKFHWGGKTTLNVGTTPWTWVLDWIKMRKWTHHSASWPRMTYKQSPLMPASLPSPHAAQRPHRRRAALKAAFGQFCPYICHRTRKVTNWGVWYNVLCLRDWKKIPSY